MSATKAQPQFPWAKFLGEHGIHSDWMAPIAAKEYLGVASGTLVVWSRKGCPFLHGRSLGRKRFHVYGRRFVECYRKADLDEARQAKFLLPTTANSQGSDGWITKKQAAKITGYDERYLRSVISRGSPFLPNRRIATRRERGLVPHGRTFPITLVSRKDVEDLVRNRDGCRIPDDRVPIRQAAHQLGLASHKVLHQWLLTGCPHLDGRRRPDVIQGHVRYRGQIQPTNLLLKSELEEIRQRMQRGPFEPFVNARGNWLPIDLAVKKYPNARRELLYLHKNRACPQLNGEILHAIPIRRITPKTFQERSVWAFLEDDLRSLNPPQPGGRRRVPTVMGNGAPITTEGPSPQLAPKLKKRPGRTKGWLDKDTQDKYRKIRNAFEAGELNKSKLARNFRTSRRSVDRALAAQVRG